MSPSNILSVATGVFFGWLINSVTPTYAAASNHTNASLKQKTVQYSQDASITLAVKNRLLQNKKTQHLDISVKTTNGQVLLTGVVDTWDQLNEVRQQVSKVEGVRAVNTQITVKNSQRSSKSKERPQTLSEYGSDVAITAKLKAKLIADDRLSANDITVETNQGVVSLTGTLDNQQQINIAEKLAREVKDVKRVNNQLRLKDKADL